MFSSCSTCQAKVEYQTTSSMYCKLYKCNNLNSTTLLTSDLRGVVIHIKAGVLKV